LVRAWRVLPDFVSVNFDEDGAEKRAGLVLSLGVAVEAGLAAPAAADNEHLIRAARWIPD
jgi:hypothetical protein